MTSLLKRFRLQLIAEWRDVLAHAWSIRLIVVAGVLSGVEAALPLLDGFLPIPVGVFSGLTFIVVAAAFVARIMAQRALPGSET